MGVQGLLATIPYVVWHEIEVLEESEIAFEMRLRNRPEVHNYVGTMHAGALYTLAETVAGVAADRFAGDQNAFILLRDASVHYTRRAEGDIIARSFIDPSNLRTATDEMKENGRAIIQVSISARDTSGETVFEGSFTYALRPRKQ